MECKMHKSRRKLLGGEVNTASERQWLSRFSYAALIGEAPSRFACYHHPDGDPAGGGTGGGTGGGGTTPPENETEEQKAERLAAEQKAKDEADPYFGLTDEQKAKLKKFHQDEANRVAAKAREEGKTTGKTEAQKAADAAKAESDRKAEEAKGEWKTLYEGLKAELVPLKAKADQFDELAGEVHKLIDGEIAEWPDSVKKSDPGATASVVARRQWVENNRDVAAELIAARKPPASENGSGSGGGGGRPAGGSASTVVGRYTSSSRYAVPGAKKAD